MKKTVIGNIKIYKIDIGPRVVALRRMVPVLTAMKVGGDLKKVLLEAIAADEALFEDEMRWRGRKRHRVEHGADAVELDRKIDNALVGIDEVLTAQRRFREDKPEQAAAAEAMARDLFPAGVAGVTRLRFADQTLAVSAILKRIDANPEYAQLAEDLGFAATVERLRELNAAYAAEISAHEAPNPDQLNDDRRRGEERLGGIIARIFGQFPDETLEHQEAREKLFAPLAHQNELMRRLRRRHGQAADDDLESDEPQEDSSDVDVA